MSPDHTIKTLTEFLAQNFKSPEINSFGIYNFLKLIFFNNIFSFDGQFFIQTNGLAMGMIYGPSIANLYLYIIERHWVNLKITLFYGRFIDDICLITNGEADIEELKSVFSYLKLDYESKEKINFLDLIISVDNNLNRLEFEVY